MWTGRFFWGEEEDRKFPQLLLSTSPPSLKAEHALRSFTDRFSDKIAVRKASAAFIPLISQNWNTCTRQLFHALQHFLPQPGQKVHEKMGVQQMGEGAPRAVSEITLGETDGDGNVRVCARNGWNWTSSIQASGWCVTSGCSSAALQNPGVSYYLSRKGRFKSFSGEHYSTGEFYSNFTPLLIVYL